MAIGDQTDMFNRLKSNLVNWFGNDSPVVDALLKGMAITDSTNYSQYASVNQQSRIKTATGQSLDLIGLDYFNPPIIRHNGENDSSYRARILANLIQERCTRQGMYNVLLKLTGIPPWVVEGTYGGTIGAYDKTLFYDSFGGIGFLAPYTAIIYVFTTPATLMNGYGAYDSFNDDSTYNGFGYDFNFNNAYVDISQEIISVSNADIISAIQATKVEGTVMYVYVNGIFLGVY